MSGALHPHPVPVPPRLLAAFEQLGASPVLVGGTAVQAWTGLTEGLFQTFDLDFITSLRASDFLRAGLEMEPSGRHLMVAEAYPQAMAIAIAQAGQAGWDRAWMEKASKMAGLSKQWIHLQSELDRDAPDARGLDEALNLGWD